MAAAQSRRIPSVRKEPAMFEKKFPWGKFAWGFVAGAATGVVAALLLAPMTGKKLQKQLKNVYEDQVDNVEKIVKKVVNA
jgi:uncharacterized membrane-anchored protein YhcB (DUF1043 family)